MLAELTRALLVQLVDLLFNKLQLLERHFQQPAVDRVELRARAERVAQLFRRGAQLLIGQGGQSRWLGFTLGERLQHAPGTGAQ
jgi:hypothetical protein